jgi:hypothetical protein
MSSIDPKKLFDDMLAAAGGVIQSNAPAVKSYLEKVMQNHKDILTQLAQSRVVGHIDDAQLQTELDDEKEALQAELEGAELLTARIAQDAANAAIGVVLDAVKTALKV